MESYKEKYEQALMIAKETYDKQPMYREWLEKMFPELAGGEDEKVRNHIRRAISVALDYSYFDKETANNCLAWLEKQDKSSSEVRYWTEEEIEPIISDYLRGAEHYGGMIGRLRCLKPKCLEEQGEQKLIDYNEELKKCRKNPLYFFDKYVKLKEQNHAWSEEEECYICQLESMVKERWALAEKAQDEEVIKNMSNLAFFLKTLNPNKKPADEEMKTLLRTEYEKGRADAIADMHWLKSLRPQNRWKPSDEQIEALNFAANCIVPAEFCIKRKVLKELLEQLKKLKEEKV